jgi:hypothetical protein
VQRKSTRLPAESIPEQVRMLKLVEKRTSPPAAKLAARPKVSSETRALYIQLNDERSLGYAAQRAVARARRRIVEVHCHAKGLEPGADPRAARTRIAARSHQSLAGLSRRLAEIHRRLLELSSGIELEMDRLDVVTAGIDEVVSRAERRKP